MNTYSFEDYPFQIEPLSGDDGGGYVIRFPDLPGCMSDGETIDATIANGRDAFRAWIDSAVKDGAPIPPPNGLGEPAKFVQRLPRSLHAQLLRAASREGTSMNTLVTVLVAEGLSRRERPAMAKRLKSSAKIQIRTPSPNFAKDGKRRGFKRS